MSMTTIETSPAATELPAAPPSTDGSASRESLLEGLRDIRSASEDTSAAPPAELAAPDVEADVEPKSAAEPESSEDDPRLRQLQRQEEAARERLAAERATLDDERASWAAKLEEYDAYSKARTRAAVDPVDLLLKLGIPQDDLEEVARIIYTHAKGETDPAARRAVNETRAMREVRAEMESLREQVAARDKADAEAKEARDREAQNQVASEQAKTFITSVAKAATDKHGHVKSMLERAPEQAHALMARAAGVLWDKHGEKPREADILDLVEREVQNHLQTLGVTLSPSPAVAETKPRPTIGGELAAPRTTPPRPLTAEEQRQEILTGLASIRVNQQQEQ